MLTLSPGEEVVSSVGGKRVSTVERWIAGYQAGAKGANPRVTTLNGYTDDFLDPVKGRAVALSQIAKGSRVVFQVASTCGLGALEAASEHGVWEIGVDVDQSHLGPHILTSALKRLDVAVFDTIEDLTRGTLEPGRTSYLALEDGGVGLGTISAQVPGSFKAEIEDCQGRDRRRDDLGRELGYIAPSLWIETHTVPPNKATSVGAWPTDTRPTTWPSRASIWTTAPSALAAANTTPSVAARPTNPPPTGVVWFTVAVYGLMLQTCPRTSETQTASLPAINATGSPTGTSVVALSAGGSMRRARSAVVATQSASSPSARPTGTWPTSMIPEGSFVVGSMRST